MEALNTLLFDLPGHVTIRELGPREGFQIHSKTATTTQKLRLIRALVEANVPSLEVTAMVRSDRVPQLADAEEVIAALEPSTHTEYTALYLNVKGFERGENSKRLANKGWLYSSPSDAFLKSNNNLTIKASIQNISEWLAAFEKSGKKAYGLLISTAFGCHFAGKISTDQVLELVGSFVEECSKQGQPLTEVCLADTIGLANPTMIKERVLKVRALGVKVSLHLHDTYGLGIANAYAGLECGVDTFEASVGGMGGCPFAGEKGVGAAGNVATEDLVYLCESLGISTGINLQKLCQAARIAEDIIGCQLPGRVYRSHAPMKVYC